MGIKQIKTKLFLQFLKELGIVYKRTKGDHDIYDHPTKPLQRPIVVVTIEKEIPITHIHSNLRTLGISKGEFEKWLKKNN